MIDELIDRIFATKAGNKEFILSAFEPAEWFAAIGNKSQHVAIGEAITYGEEHAEFYAEGVTAKEALEALLHKMAVTAAA